MALIFAMSCVLGLQARRPLPVLRAMAVSVFFSSLEKKGDPSLSHCRGRRKPSPRL